MIYYNASGETRDIEDALYAAWVAAGNPKAQAWTLQPAQPEFDPATHSCTWVGTEWALSQLPPPPVPEQVPAHHLRRALRQFGMLGAVKAYMTALPEDSEMKESWEYAPYFRRDALGIEAARVALGLTAAQVDALFFAADAVQT